MNSIAKGFSSSFTNDAEIEYTRKQMLKALKRNLSRKTTLSQEEIDTKAEKLMRLHGLSQDNTDFLKMFQKQLNANINDVSIDDNANKNEKTIAGIQSEASAPQKKIAGYDFLYRVMKELYGKKRAKRLIGEMLDFSLPISDSTKLNLPYSYYGNTPVFVRINGEIICIPLKKLFNMFAIHSENRGTHEEINTKGLTRDLEITTAMLRNNVSANITNKNTAKGRSGKLACNVSEKVNIEVWDTNNGWVAVQRIIKHKTDTGFSLYQTEAGHFALVTDNHPIYMEDGTEKIASELSVGDAVLTETCLPSVEKTIIVPEKLAYLLGFMLGDGNFEGYCVDDGVMNGKDIKGSFRFTRGGTLCSVYQNDIDNSRIYSIIKDLFPDANLFKPSDKVERQINWSSYDMNFLVSAFFGFGNKENSFTKVLPKNILSWTNDSVEALVAGLVDADGYTYKKNGRVEICLQSMAVINTLYDVLRGIEGIRCLRKRIKGSDISNSIYALSFVPSSTNKMVDLSDKMKMHKEDYDKYNEKANTKGESNRVVKIIRFNLEDIPSTRKLREELQDVYDLTTATGRFYANGMVQHNCYSLNATNLITEGRTFGVLPSKPAKRVNSYIAALCETIHQMSSHVAGALAIGTVFIDVAHLLMIKNKVPLDVLKNDKAVRKEIENEFQQLIHSVNHLSRDGVESPFTNVSVFDKHKLRYIIKEHLLWMFSDGGVVDIEECVDYVFELQEIFLDIFDKGDPSNNGMPYRFPVCTMNISKTKDGDDYILADEESLEIFLNRDISRYNIFTSESTKIASCCRLINDEEMLDVASTSNSFGAGVLSSIGSHRVVTLNFNKMAIEAESIDDFWKIYTYRVEAAKDILIAHKVLIHVLEQIGLQPFITRGWIDLNRLFSTFGILGLYECEKVLKQRFGVEGDLKKKILTFLNRKARLYTKKNAGYVFNIEQIPAESMAVKVCSADKIIHGDTFIEYPLYANQFVPLWEEASLWDRLRIDGEYTKNLTGGGIVHATVGQRLTREQAKKIICFALSCGCEHFAINTVYSECINSHVSMGSFSTCPICSEDISTQLTRVVGFFTPVKAWNKTRREFDFPYRKFVDKSI